MSEYETGECKTCDLLSDRILKMEDKLLDAAVDCGRQAGQISMLRSENKQLTDDHAALVEKLRELVAPDDEYGTDFCINRDAVLDLLGDR